MSAGSAERGAKVRRAAYVGDSSWGGCAPAASREWKDRGAAPKRGMAHRGCAANNGGPFLVDVSAGAVRHGRPVTGRGNANQGAAQLEDGRGARSGAHLWVRAPHSSDRDFPAVTLCIRVSSSCPARRRRRPGANHVIHVERHWNPAKEAQATGSRHRMGQTRELQVHYQVALHPDVDSFDVNLDRTLRTKAALKDAVVVPQEVRQEESRSGRSG